MRFNVSEMQKKRAEAAKKLEALEKKEKEKKKLYDGLNLSLMDKGKTKDKLVQNVINRMAKRSNEGLIEYQVSMEDAKHSFDYWAKNLQEDMMDAILYVEKMRKEHKSMMQYIKKYAKY